MYTFLCKVLHVLIMQMQDGCALVNEKNALSKEPIKNKCLKITNSMYTKIWS